MVVYKKKKEYIPVFKDVETLVNEGYSPKEIQYILKVQQMRGWNEEVPTLKSIEATRKQLLKTAESQVKIKEFWRHKKIDKSVEESYPLERNPIYRRSRFLGKLYSFIGTDYLREQIKVKSASKFRIADNAIRRYKTTPYYKRIQPNEPIFKKEDESP